MISVVSRRDVDDAGYSLIPLGIPLGSGGGAANQGVGPPQLQFPNTCIIPCVEAYAEVSGATVVTLCDESTEYQKDFKFCMACVDVYGDADAEPLKREVINPRFATYIDICARRVLGTSSFSPAPTATDAAALESVWSSLSNVASSKGYKAPATDLVISTTVTTLVPTTLAGGAVSSVVSEYTTLVPNPKYFAQSTTSPSPSTDPTSSPTEASKPEKSSAWIAGPVVGSIIGVLLIAGVLGFFILRRRRRALSGPGMEEDTLGADGALNKAQLHADPIAPSPPTELQGDRNYWAGETTGNVNGLPVELPAHAVGGNTEVRGT